MYEAPSVASPAPLMPLTRTYPSMLLFATVMAVLSLCQLVVHKVDAVGKGKGTRQGHIIIQNELKGDQVPIYMPIPIPIPMPMGPAMPNHGGKHHHHKQQHNSRDEGDQEVKKIYLLQPMSRPPHLKGGALPSVQNHIHLGSSAYSSGKHRYAPVQASSANEYYTHKQQQQHEEQFAASKHQQKSTDVKILPIVVIPPVAPVPPVQLMGEQRPASQSPRMTLSPQFNNYVLAAAAGGAQHERKRATVAAGRHYADQLGGSLGGSLFREQYAAKRRQNRLRNSRVPSNEDFYAGGQQRMPVMRSARDYDYGDYDGGLPQAPIDQVLAARSSEMDPLDRDALTPLPANHQIVRRNHYGSGNYDNYSRRDYQRFASARARGLLANPNRVSSQQYENLPRFDESRPRIRSIRDMIEALNRQPAADEDLPGASADQNVDYSPSAQLRRTRLSQTSQLDADSLRDLAQAARQQPNLEISLEELSQLDRELGQQQARANHDTNYNEQREQQAGFADNYLGSASNSNSVKSPAGGYDAPGLRPDERAQLLSGEEDWHAYDSVKSVAHSAPDGNATEIKDEPQQPLVKVEFPLSTDGGQVDSLNKTSTI